MDVFSNDAQAENITLIRNLFAVLWQMILHHGRGLSDTYRIERINLRIWRSVTEILWSKPTLYPISPRLAYDISISACFNIFVNIWHVHLLYNKTALYWFEHKNKLGCDRLFGFQNIDSAPNGALVPEVIVCTYSNHWKSPIIAELL